LETEQVKMKKVVIVDQAKNNLDGKMEPEWTWKNNICSKA
jgi:hypothetical protein